MKRKDIEARVLWTVEEWQGVIDIPTLIGTMKEHTKAKEHEIRLAMEKLVDKGKLHIDKWMHLRLGKNER